MSDPVNNIRINPPTSSMVLPKEVPNRFSRVAKVFSRGLNDILKGLWSSRVCSPFIFVIANAIPFLSIAFAHFDTPGFCFPGGFKRFKQDLSVEGGALKRLWSFKYNEITWKGKKTDCGKIFLGPMPNHLSIMNSPNRIAKKEGLTAVLSVNAGGSASEGGERIPRGLLQPSTAADWQEKGIICAEIDQPDHKPLSIAQLKEAADFIHCIVSKGGNIYVHCKAGQGRSAMAIAAYLIQYQKMDAIDAIKAIMQCRPKATLEKDDKVERLIEFEPIAAKNLEERERDHFLKQLNDYFLKMKLQEGTTMS